MQVIIKVPPFALVNLMERRLISLIQPFMKLTVLPYGQRALKAQTVNFPVNTSEVCSSLPRTLGIVLIAPPRTGSSDSTFTELLFSTSTLCNQGLAVVVTT